MNDTLASKASSLTDGSLDGVDRLLSLDQTAQLCSVSIWTIRKWVGKGKIRTVKLGARRLVPKSEIHRLTCEGLVP